MQTPVVPRPLVDTNLFVTPAVIQKRRGEQASRGKEALPEPIAPQAVSACETVLQAPAAAAAEHQTLLPPRPLVSPPTPSPQPAAVVIPNVAGPVSSRYSLRARANNNASASVHNDDIVAPAAFRSRATARKNVAAAVAALLAADSQPSANERAVSITAQPSSSDYSGASPASPVALRSRVATRRKARAPPLASRMKQAIQRPKPRSIPTTEAGNGTR